MITYIDDSLYVEARCDIAEALLHAQGLPVIWVEDSHGSQSMDEETQERFNDCYHSAQCILENLNIEPEAAKHD
jgi:hypothetical protein